MSQQDKLDALKAGDHAPPFTLADPGGLLVSSADLLPKGPLAVTFYRGMWCPYCRLDLQAFEAVASDVQACGASLVAISHQTADRNGKLQLDFPLLDDKGGDVAVAFGIRWAPGDLQSMQERLGADVSVFHSDMSWIRPMQARFVMGRDGIIAYADINSDYTQRPEPPEILPVLRRLKTGGGA